MMHIQETIRLLSLEEKAALLQGWTTWTTWGIPRVRIPEIFLSDGPHGLRKQAGSADHLGLNPSLPSTCFPTAATMANSWDPALGEELGRALGTEAAANNVHVVLGPGLNIKRSPLCGRNFEYFSEDPYLSGKMAAGYIRGIQENGLAACPKHFAANSQEMKRMAADSVMDERTLREIYLTGFEIAVREGHAKSIMSSYNRINGTYANENRHLLTDILREEWGFDGFVVTDWGADNDHVEGVRAGSNLVMPAPGPDCAQVLVDAVRSGNIEESVLDQRLAELLAVIDSTSQAVSSQEHTFDPDAHHALARRCAQESIVLLDNDGILPLSPDARVAVIGEFANSPRYQGAGSSQVNPTQVDNFYDCAMQAGMQIIGYAPGYDRKNPKPDPKHIEEAVTVAQQAEIVLLFVGLEEIMESEGMDRTHMDMSESQQELIARVAEVNDNVVLVISGGAPFVMPPRDCYRAAIHGYLSGQAGAGAMLDALLGKVNPSGKLNETWPLALSDTPANAYFPGKMRSCEYREGLFVGYRYYDTADVAVRYPFGYGLSYTQFAYSDLSVSQNGATFTITNTGSRDGSEIAQMYIACPGSRVYRPQKELKGFVKVALRPGESQQVTIPFEDTTFRYYNAEHGCWAVEEADYQILIASNASQVQLRATYHVSGVNWEDSVPDCYRSGRIQHVADEDFRQLLGKPIPDDGIPAMLSENDTLSQLVYAKSWPARLLGKLLEHLKTKPEEKGTPDLNVLFVYYMPFRAIAKMSNGMVSRQMVEDMLFLANGHFFRGLGRLIRDFFRNRSHNRKFTRLIKAQGQLKE